MLRRAMRESGYSLDALSAAIEAVLGPPGEPLQFVAHVARPPADAVEVHSRHAARSAASILQLQPEACGLVYVQRARLDTAKLQIIAGVLGLLPTLDSAAKGKVAA
jgi:hypothetical protein